jgi:hypothetical protein
MSFWSRNWWVFVFCVLTVLTYFHFFKEKRSAIYVLNMRLKEMQAEKSTALERREELELCLASHSDPAWIEMVLIRDLGVVPEGFLKVHFKR